MGRLVTDEELVRLHEIMLEMLVEFDEFCDRHDIKYVITGGTLLGAVRHKGYIPWDDDADIALTRREYQKLIRYADELRSDTLFFQDHSTDKGYLWGYGKLRRPGTKLVRAGQEHLDAESGVYIDVFPMDDIPRYLPLQFVSYWFYALLRKILWARVAVKDKSLPFVNRVIFNILNLVPVDSVYALINHINEAKPGERNRLVHPWARPLWNRTNKEGVPL